MPSQWKRWQFRLQPKFSISTLLLLTAIAALVAVWWREKQRHAETSRQLVKEIARSDMLEQHVPISAIERAAGVSYRFRGRIRNEGRFKEALEIYKRLYNAEVEFYGEGDRKTLDELFFVGELYNLTDQPDKAEPFLVRFLGYTEGQTSTHRGVALSHLAGIRRKQRRFKEAERLLRECLTVKKSVSPDHWTVFHATSGLGECLLEQNELSEAEPLLLEGYEGLVAREEKLVTRRAKVWDIHRLTRLALAAERLVTLYEAWGKPNEAVKWRQEWERIKAKYEATEHTNASVPNDRER